MRKTLLLISLLITSLFNVAQGDTAVQIEHILKQEEPFGVVFEIVQGDDDALQWAIPAVNQYLKKLRQRFPDINLAVVSHGSEQFGLMKSEQKNQAKVHQLVQSLVSSEVPVHVCGTHASWYGKDAEDFPDYVDVTPAGPTEIRNYKEMGYELVIIERP